MTTINMNQEDLEYANNALAQAELDKTELEKELAELKAGKAVGANTIPPEVEKFLKESGLKIVAASAKEETSARKTVATELIARFGSQDSGEEKEITASAIDELAKKAGIDNISSMAMKLAAMSEGKLK